MMKRVFILVTSSDVSFLFYIRAIDHFKIAWLWGFKLVEIVQKIQDSFANQTSIAKYEKKKQKWRETAFWFTQFSPHLGNSDGNLHRN